MCIRDSGNTVTGSRVIDGKTYYFNQDGSVGTAYSLSLIPICSNGAQVKGKLLTVQGKKCYFDAHTGEQVVNRFVEAGRGCWYYFNAAGQEMCIRDRWKPPSSRKSRGR